MQFLSAFGESYSSLWQILFATFYGFHLLSICWPFQGREGKHTLSPKPCMLDKSQMHPPIIQHVGKGETGLHGPINRPLSSAAAVVVKIICRWMVGNFPPLSQVLEMSLLPNICLAIVTNLINKWFGTSWFCHYCQNVTHGVVTLGGHICTLFLSTYIWKILR